MQQPYEEVQISSAGGRITLSIWETAQARATVVFIPGSLMHPLTFAGFLESLCSFGFNIIGVHPIGHGKSDRPKKAYTILDIIQNAKDAVTYAASHYDLPILASGSSQGGIVAAALAAQDRRIFAAFPHNAVLTELSETASSISRLPKLLLKLYKPAVGWLRFMSKLFPRLPVPLWLYLDPRRISQDVSLLLAIGRDPLTIKSYSLKFVVSLITQTYPELTDASATSRLYLLCPTQDMLFPLAYSELVFSKIKFPHKEMVLLPGYGHLFMVSDPVQAAQAISAKMLEALSFATI